MSHVSGEPPGAGQPAQEHSQRLPRVLCVDDEPPALSTLRRVLRGGFSIATADNVSDALALLERDGDFAAVIADINMPEMSGLDFLDLVREKSPTTARLALTGLSPLALTLPHPDRVFRVLNKPCPREVLVEALSDAVSYHQLIASSRFQPVESLYAPSPGAPAPAPAARRLLPFDPAVAGAPAILARDELPMVQQLAMTAQRIGLRLDGRTIELLVGVTLVGRSRTCHIPIDDPKVSRRHACFTHDERQLTLQNLSSTKPVLLNGAPVDAEEHALEVGDRVTIGSHEIEVCVVGDYTPSLEPTQRFSVGLSAVPAPASSESEAATLRALADVADKYVRLGHARDAERILRPVLHGLLRHCGSGHSPQASDVSLAVELALGLAESRGAGEWISYVFDLLSAVARPPDAAVVEQLYRIAPTTPGISTLSYRSYLEKLSQGQARWGPAERFLVRRVQGLDAAISRSRHL